MISIFAGDRIVEQTVPIDVGGYVIVLPDFHSLCDCKRYKYRNHNDKVDPTMMQRYW